MNKKNSLAVLALILTTSCASAQYTEFPYDIRMGTNADIFLNDNTNALGDRLAALSNQIVSGVTSVTNPAIVLTDGSRAMLLLNALNTNSLGSELLANNDFSGSADNWALTNCAYSANGITITGATTATITFTNTLALGAYKTCQIGLDITGTGPVASLTFAFAGKTGTVSSISTGVYRFAVTAELTNGLRWTIVTTNGLTIDNATVKIISDGDGLFGDQITAGGDVRVGGQLRGATNMATAADLATETAARVAGDAALTGIGLTNETIARIDADTALSNSIAAAAIRNTKLGFYYETAPNLLTNGTFGVGATSSWIRQSGSPSDLSWTNGYFGATNSAGGGGGASLRQSIALTSGTLFQVYLLIDQFSGQFASVTVPGITATNAGLYVSNYLSTGTAPLDLGINQSCENCGTGFVKVARVAVWPISTNNVLSLEYFDGSLWYSTNRITWKRVSVISTNL